MKNVGFSKLYLSSESLIIPVMCSRNSLSVRLTFLQDERKIQRQNFYLGLLVKYIFYFRTASILMDKKKKEENIVPTL